MTTLNATDAETLIKVLAKALRRMDRLQAAMMAEANHKESAWSAETIRAMNEAPRETHNALALFELYGFKHE